MMRRVQCNESKDEAAATNEAMIEAVAAATVAAPKDVTNVIGVNTTMPLVTYPISTLLLPVLAPRLKVSPPKVHTHTHSRTKPAKPNLCCKSAAFRPVCLCPKAGMVCSGALARLSDSARAHSEGPISYRVLEGL